MTQQNEMVTRLPMAREEAKRITKPYPAHGNGFVLRVDGNEIVGQIADIQSRTILGAADCVALYAGEKGSDIVQFLTRLASTLQEAHSTLEGLIA